MDTTHVLQQFAEYPFETDDEYQQGLASILAGALNGDREEILHRSKVFYFNRLTGHSVTVEDVRQHEGRDPAPRTLTFAELKELIETGRTDQIPNNKIIPEGLNDAPPSEAMVPARKKPWECQ